MNRGYVVANSTNAVFYADHGKKKFQMRTRLSNPQGDWKDGELNGDKQHEELNKKFSREISEKIKYLQKEEKWDQLVLVAEPRFLGFMKDALSHQQKNLVAEEIPLELTHEKPRELHEHILKVMKGAV